MPLPHLAIHHPAKDWRALQAMSERIQGDRTYAINLTRYLREAVSLRGSPIDQLKGKMLMVGTRKAWLDIYEMSRRQRIVAPLRLDIIHALLRTIAVAMFNSVPTEFLVSIEDNFQNWVNKKVLLICVLFAFAKSFRMRNVANVVTTRI